MPPEQGDREGDGRDSEAGSTTAGEGSPRPEGAAEVAPEVTSDASGGPDAPPARPSLGRLADRIDALLAAGNDDADDDDDEHEIVVEHHDKSNGSGARPLPASAVAIEPPRVIKVPPPSGPPAPPPAPADDDEELSDFEELAIEADAPPISAPRPLTRPGVPPVKPPAFPRASARGLAPPPPMPTVRIPPPRPIVIPPLAPREPARDAKDAKVDAPVERKKPATAPPPTPADAPVPAGDAGPRARTPSAPPPLPDRKKPPTPAPAPIAPSALDSEPGVAIETDDIEIEGTAEALRPSDDDGHVPGSIKPNVVVDAPLEQMLEKPTAVERALADMGDAALERRADVLTAELDAATDKRLIAGLAYELGELCERRLADEARAVKAFGRALAADPSHRPNLWAIRRVFYRRALWPNLVKLIDAEIRFARSDDERADLMVEKGRVLGERLGQPVEARTAFEDAYTLVPSHQSALLELERIGNRDRDHALLAKAWGGLAELAAGAARRTVYLVDLARLAADQGDHGKALEVLATAAQTGADPERVNAERIRIAEVAEDAGQLLAALDEKAALLLARFGPGGLPDPSVAPPTAGVAPDRATALRLELVAVRRRQAHVARTTGNPTAAWDSLQNALALAPGEPVVLADLIDLAEELHRYDELAILVEAWQSVEGDSTRGLLLSLRRADALLRGGNREAAKTLLATLEAAHRGFVALTSLVERDALGRKDFEEVARTYMAAGDAARLGSTLGPGIPTEPDPEAAAARYVMAAELFMRDVGTEPAIEAARAALAQALEAVPDYPPAIDARLELDQQRGDIAEAAALLSALVERGDEAQQRDALERLGRLYRSRGDLDGALDADRRLAALPGAGPDPRLPWRIEGTLAQLGKDEERAAHLEALGSTEPDPTRKQLALSSAARLFERLGQIERAIELYRASLRLDPDDTFARASLTDLLRAAERWQELVAERKAEASQLPDGPAARRALREAAWVTEVRLDDPAAAGRAWQALLERDPDDALALEGVIRTLRQAGDRHGELAALERLVEAAPKAHVAEAHLSLARGLEQAARTDDAIETYKKAIALDSSGGEVAQAAAIALIELAVAKGDTALRVEASSQLAGWCQDPKLRAALAEDVGWLAALGQDDLERASTAFGDALATEPGRRGALLGAALVAARRGDVTALAAAYAGLGAATTMTEAASALYLRASALAAAAGDEPEALARIAAARAVAPDDVGAMVVAAEAWQQPPPGTDRASLVDRMLNRAEILATRAALADDPKARASWELDRAEALEAAGRLREAGGVVAGVLRGDPEDIRALEALRRLARRGNDRPTLARASLALAKRLGDGEAKLALLREAASIFDPPAGKGDDGFDPRGAVAVYRRILAEDIGASEFARHTDLLRQGSDVQGLVACLSDRLAWIDGGNADSREAISLLLERATVHFGLGDRPAAIADLDTLIDRDPAHAEALRFRGDLALAEGDAQGAVELWRRYLEVERRPDRRHEVELVLAKVLAEDVNDLEGAVVQLARVLETANDDPALHDRMVNLATRAGDWPRVAASLRELGRLRGQSPDRAREELRLATVLRDRLDDRNGARLALDRAHAVDPLNLDVIRELSDLLDPVARSQVLHGAANDLRVAVARAPSKVMFYDRLAMIGAWQSDVDARWLALLAVEAMGTPSPDQRQVLAVGRASLPPLGKIRLTADHRKRLVGIGEPRLAAALAGLDEMWKVIAPGVTAVVGVDAGKLGFTKADRLAGKKLAERYPIASAAVVAFGVEDAELHVNVQRAGMARVLSSSPPVVCLGADIAEGATGAARFQLGRSVEAAHAGTGILTELRDVEMIWYWAAALRAAELQVPASLAEAIAGDDAAVNERARALAKHFGRKEKKALAAADKARSLDVSELGVWRNHAANVANRAGLLLCGDLAIALDMLDAGRGGRSIVDSVPALDLVAWSVGEGHHTLRRELGFALGGPPR